VCFKLEKKTSSGSQATPHRPQVGALIWLGNKPGQPREGEEYHSCHRCEKRGTAPGAVKNVISEREEGSHMRLKRVADMKLIKRSTAPRKGIGKGREAARPMVKRGSSFGETINGGAEMYGDKGYLESWKGGREKK